MRRFMLASVLIVLVSAVPSWADNPRSPIVSGEVASKLADLGYFATSKARAEARTGVIDPTILTTAANRYIGFHGLEPSVTPIETVEAHLAKNYPRCGVPDFVEAENAELCRWPHLDVRFWQSIKVSGLTDAQVADAWAKALQSWADVCGITPKIVEDRAKANVASLGGRIDGAGRTLAYAYLPCGASANEQLTQLYDNAERWTPVFLQEVMAHELGHSLGLNHARAGNLMQPYATGTIVVPQAGDIIEAARRYGTPEPKPVPNPKPEPKPQPKPDGPIVISGEIKINGDPYRLVPSGGAPSGAGDLLKIHGVTWERVMTTVTGMLATFFGIRTFQLRRARSA